MAVKNNKIKCKYFLQGVPASPGIAISKVFKLKGESMRIDPTIVKDSSVDTEVEKFVKAVEKSKSELKTLQSKVVHKVGQENAKIFDVHQLLLEDSVIIEETISVITKENRSESTTSRMSSNASCAADAACAPISARTRSRWWTRTNMDAGPVTRATVLTTVTR